MNRIAVRQIHPMETPFNLATAIPSGSVNCTLECLNGYHSVPLAPEDRALTTFITPWGKYRYLVAPQGFLAAGDAYTARLSVITAEITNKKQLVDDMCVYNDTLAENFIEAIRDFPRPRDITGIRSWFGLVNQVNFALSQSDTMLPFRALLKPSSDFLWTQDLQDAFEASKEEIK